MPSFKATIQEVILDADGFVDLFVQAPFVCTPVNLKLASATIQGDPSMTKAEGAIQLTTVVAVFPASQVEDFVAGEEVIVSWRHRPDNTLEALSIAAIQAA